MLLLEVQDIPSHAEIYTLRTAKVIENHIKDVVRGVYRGSKGISIIGSLYVATLWGLRAIKSELFCFFQHRILFCLNRNLFFAT